MEIWTQSPRPFEFRLTVQYADHQTTVHLHDDLTKAVKKSVVCTPVM